MDNKTRVFTETRVCVFLLALLVLGIIGLLLNNILAAAGGLFLILFPFILLMEALGVTNLKGEPRPRNPISSPGMY